MIETGYYTKQQDKLVKKFKKTLKRYELQLSAQYGEEFAKTINVDAMAYYIELIPRIPDDETALYRPIILLNAQLIAIVGQIQGGNEG
jgi:murein L,D-transpeptidase YafK